MTAPAPEPDGRRILDSVFSSPKVVRRLAEQRAARLRGRKKRRPR